MQQSQHQRALYEFLIDVRATQTVEDAWKASLDYMVELGASHVGLKLGIDTPDPLFLWTAPQWVIDMYMQTVYPDEDPRIAHCREHATPYFYGRSFWRKDEVLPRNRRVYDEELIAADMRSIVAIPFHARQNPHLGIFGVATDMTRKEFERFFASHGASIHLAALGACSQVRSLMRGRQPCSTPLSGRERECLLWLGRGLRNDQIADRLNVQTVTVEFHLANARRKLNARTREQALVRAIQVGAIDP